MHLPFFALRHEKKLRSDHRATAKGTVFKRSRSLQFSQGFQQTPNESYPLLNLYEGQISIVVTGIDDWRWSTWAFIDAFFDRSESARNFDDISQPYRVDPLLRGQLRVSHEQDPRRYFLDVCRTQAERVEEEWNAIFQVVKEMVEQQYVTPTRDWFGSMRRWLLLPHTTRGRAVCKIHNQNIYHIAYTLCFSRLLTQSPACLCLTDVCDDLLEDIVLLCRRSLRPRSRCRRARRGLRSCPTG